MAKSGQTKFQNSVINPSLQTELPSFVKVMGMMAVPTSGAIYDVTPKNGIKPIFYNNKQNMHRCIGYVDPEMSYIDEDNDEYVLVLYNYNPESSATSLGIYASGTVIYGAYEDVDIDGTLYPAMVGPIEGETDYGIIANLVADGPQLVEMPVWKVDSGLIMEHELDWSGGMTITEIGSQEYSGFNADETVAVKTGVDQVCDWKKLPDATGISISLDTVNSLYSSIFTTGIITAGKPSPTEPDCWQLTVGEDAYLIVKLNLSDINYRQLGRYYFNVGQGNDNYLMVSPLNIVRVDTGTEGGDAAILADSPVIALIDEEYSYLVELTSSADDMGSGETGILIYKAGWGGNGWYVESPGNTWYLVGDTYFCLNITIIAERLVGTVSIASGHVDTIPAQYETKYGTLKCMIGQVTYDIWWDTETLTYATNCPGTYSGVATYIWYNASYDGAKLTYPPLNPPSLFYLNGHQYPEYVYYFRLKFMWNLKNYASAPISTVWEDIGIYTNQNNDPRYPDTYGIYALSNYRVDDYGNQHYDALLDASGDSRYCGIYGRNYLTRLDAQQIDETPIYPADTTITHQYPGRQPSTLLTRAAGETQNNVEYLLTGNKIVFDLTEQRAVPSETAPAHACYTIPGGTKEEYLEIEYRYPGCRGNGHTLKIVYIDSINTGLGNAVLKDIPSHRQTLIIIGANIRLSAIAQLIADHPESLVRIKDNHAGDHLIGASVDCTLTNGGTESITTNNGSGEPLETIRMHPGYIKNLSYRQSPVSNVGIYAYYLSGNYASAGGLLDVVAVDGTEGIELYAAIYFGPDRDRYELVSDIVPEAATYTDVDLAPDYAKTTEIPSQSSDVVVTAKLSGWAGNSISISFVRVDTSDPMWAGTEENYLISEDVIAKSITISCKSVEGEMAVTLTTDRLLDMLVTSLLVTAEGTLGKEVTIDKKADTTYWLSGGGTDNELTIHSRGQLLALSGVDGTYTIQKLSDGTWLRMFETQPVDLLAYKLENVYVGYLKASSQHEAPNSNVWDVYADNEAAAMAVITHATKRASYGMAKYITIDGYEIELVEIIRDGSNIVITTTDMGTSTIKNKLLSKEGLPCYIADIFNVAAQNDSVNKAMIYYGRYQPRIAVQLPQAGQWGTTPIPFYVIRLQY